MVAGSGGRKAPLDLAILISGAGRSLQNLLDRIRDGRLSARIRVVVSSVADAPGLARAREAGIPVHEVPRRGFASDQDFSSAITGVIEEYDVDVVVLAGFLHRWLFPERYRRHVVNIHPALLPRFGGRGFYGIRVHREVLRAGERESGCTVHLADHEYDRGPILLQRRVPVLEGDTPESLAARVFAEECEALPEVLARFADGSLPAVQGAE